MSFTRWQVVDDVLVAAVLLAVDIGVAGNLLKDRPDESWRLVASIAVAGVLTLGFMLRRRWPLSVLVVTVSISLPAALLGVLWDPFLATVFTLYTYSLTTPWRRSRQMAMTCAGVVVVALGVGELLRPGEAWWYAFGVPLLACAWRWGRSASDRDELANRLERQREHQVLVDERLRIARELHDVVTHGMGLIAVKAGIANHIAKDRPEEARDALRVIEATSREALTEMRRLLGVLRQDVELAPTPTLDGLPELAARAATAGVDVELTMGDPRDVPEPVQLAAYRIVQEAVTNVIKHAAPARCWVTVRAERAIVSIEVTDDGRHASVPTRGHGLTGMQERVAMYDGEFAAGPDPDGGFKVTATLRFGGPA
ncbi:sensor histidine kinase [Actinocrispum wychmicini]|uniref:histidine kinase n=1 Tax=Actinocrispum wychmicini TaxID=1213861 RepID=A0A4R2JSE6_9PSEU|nr:sensor histidine kinase [Actinocrispum wychmicini]TCO59799.1 signal transduction histidine kinase [Actinocrispum wychmicini]